MYAVYIKQGPNETEESIHSPFIDAEKLFDAKVVKDVDGIDSFSFSIYPNNPGYNKLNYLTTLIEVINKQTGKSIFRGRVLEPEDTMNSDGELLKEVTCGGELSFLHDSLQKWQKWQNMTPKQFFEALIIEHNKQVEPYKKFTVGLVDVTNSTDNIYRYTNDDESTYETIREKLINRLGGELQIRYENGVRYLDYLQQTGNKGTQKIELSVNLKSISRDIDPSEMITVLKPLGKRLEKEDDNTDASAPRLTIASVNNGDIYLRDEFKIEQFGLKIGAKVWDDITQENILLTRGKQFLANQKTALIKYQIDAIDLAPLDLSVDFFECGWRYDVFNPLMGIDEELRIINQTIDINDPTGSTFGIGDKVLSQEQYNLMLKRQAKSAGELKNQVYVQSKNIVRLQGELENTANNLTNLQNQVNSGSGDVQNQITAIIDEIQVLIGEINDLSAMIPDADTMQVITQAISDLETFKQAQISWNENQETINTDFDRRIEELESINKEVN